MIKVIYIMVIIRVRKECERAYLSESERQLVSVDYLTVAGTLRIFKEVTYG